MRVIVRGLLFLLLAGCDLMERNNPGVEDAREALAQGDAAKALEILESLKGEIPERPEFYYNLGNTHLALGNFEEGSQAFLRALPLADSQLEAKILSNLGLLFLRQALTVEQDQKMPLLEKAIERLRRSVLMAPEIQETRENLELAILMHSPPCERRQDPFENNNSRASATAYSAQVAQTQLVLCPDDVDFFMVQVPPGMRMLARLATSPMARESGEEDDQEKGGEEAAAQVEGPPPPGVILELFESETGQASMKANKAGMLLKKNQDSEARTWYLGVRGLDDLEYQYALGVYVLPECAQMEDEYEDNDRMQDAVPLPQEEGVRLHLCPDDDDWYSLDTAPQEALKLGLSMQPFAGAPALEVYDHQGNMLGRGKKTSAQGPLSSLALILQKHNSPRLLIRVSSQDMAEGPYAIMAQRVEACPAGEDEFEPNDSPGEASPLPPQGAQARACPGNSDWFSLSIPPEGKWVLKLEYPDQEGELFMELFSPENTDQALAQAQAPREGAKGKVLPLEAGTEEVSYLVLIQSRGDHGIFYNLQLASSDGDDSSSSQSQNQEDQPEEEEQSEEQENNSGQQSMEAQIRELDEKERDNLEAQKAFRATPGVRTPAGKPW